MRITELHPINERRKKLARTPERDQELASWLCNEIDFSLSSRRELEDVWRVARRQYEGVPQKRVRNTPVLNAPNIEVTIGAIAADAIYAAAIDAMFTASPLLVCRATNKKWVEHSKAMQRWSNWIAANELRMRHAVDNAFVDNCQLGTAAYYIPFIEQVKKTDIHRITHCGPQIIPIATENIMIPHQSQGDLQAERWVGIRFWYTPGEVQDRAKRSKGKWDISNIMPVAHIDVTRSRRQEAAHVRTGAPWREMFEFIDVYCAYDYDGDGDDEDLLVTIDRTSRSIVAVGYNPYDTRPIEYMRYQVRAHTPYGLGIMEMMAPYQEEATELHNHRILNSLLANARMYIAERGSGIDETEEIWPSKVLMCDNINGIKEISLSDVYPQLHQFEAATLGLAEQRVGLKGELSLIARGGSRTPATTALALQQQVNRRFTPAFDGMRLATAAANRQAHWRYSERIKSGDERVIDQLEQVLGEDDALLVEELYRQDNFERAVQIEFTAASASVSREADRQNALMLANFLQQYYRGIMELIAIAAQPEQPNELRQVAAKVADKTSELIDRTIRTFDQVRDPQTFVVDVEAELGSLEQQVQGGVAEIEAMLGGLPVPAAVPPGVETPVPITGGVA